MIRFWQTDTLLLPVIQTYGCAVLDSIYLLPDEYTQEQINDIWTAAQGDGRINPATHLTNPNEIASWALWLHSLWSIDKSARPLLFQRKTSSRDYQCEPDEREIIKWYLSNVKENHFTVGDGIGNTLWDSMNRPDIMSKYSTFVEKVIVRVEG